MNVWKKYLATILFALSGVGFLVPTVKDLIKGEPVRGVFLVIAVMFFIFAVVIGRKTRGGSGPGRDFRPGSE